MGVGGALQYQQRCNRSDPRIGIYRGSDRNVPQYRVSGSDRFSDPIPIYQMIGISWGDPIRAVWELGIGIAQADPRIPRSCIVARPHYLGPEIARPPPLASGRTRNRSDTARPPPLVVPGRCPPLRRWVLNLATPHPRRFTLQTSGRTRTRTDVLGLERTPPGLHHSSFPGCPPICRCFAGRAAAAAAVVALGVVGSTWYPPPTTFICFSRCARQLVRA
ncbi:hypothetical protein PGT21_005401 [Puccinia graminis f. sp. tritici]|uniref:Uncharacterized protein n=1 Tax=Puccinia graminis f. sp. tritici TaxID=56615 RepID=A0A5B0Q4N6_PUCGR|nr:hypothetical protein PGT21_005401 [Puccinia graminis f. sp. tritici]